MTVSAVSAGSGAAVKSSSQSLAANFDNFLQLLTTQLQNQDPLAPMDANSFTSQLVQFASVEQAIQSNTKLAELGQAVQSSGTASAMGMLGQEATASTDRIALGSTGDASIRYRLAEAAATVQVSVLDDKGHVVRTATGGSGAGDNLVQLGRHRRDRPPAGGRRIHGAARRRRAPTGPRSAVEQFITGKVQGIEPKDGQIDLVDRRRQPCR